MKKLLYLLIMGGAFNGLCARTMVVANESGQDIFVNLHKKKEGTFLPKKRSIVMSDVDIPYIFWATTQPGKIPVKPDRLWKINLEKENISSEDNIFITIQDPSITAAPGIYEIGVYNFESGKTESLGSRSAEDVTD